MREANGQSELKLDTRIGFGAAEFSSSLTWTMLSLLFLYFLTDVVGLDPGFAGFILMVGTAWDAVTDPVVGIASDRMVSRWGRRRPFLLATAVPYGIATWSLFTDPGLSDLGTRLWFIAVIIFYYTTATLLEVPYTALTAEITQDYRERARLISFRAVFSQFGSIVGAASPWLLIAYFSALTHSESSAWSLTAAMFGAFSILPILWTWHKTRGHELRAASTTFKWTDLVDGPLRNRTFKYTMAGYAAGNIALGASGSIAIYFMTYYMNFDETERSIAYFFLFSCTVLWIPIITTVTTRYGKRLSFIVFVGTWALVQSIGIMSIAPDQTVVFYLLMLLASGGIVSISMTGLSMIPDAIEVDELKTGLRREGLYMGINMFIRKLCTAGALWIVGLFLSLIGYVPDQAQTEGTRMGIRMMYAFGTAGCLFVSIYLIYLMPMTEAKHRLLRSALSRKERGEFVDYENIRELL